ncbi:MAG: helix-turn-helix domain-containing protein [Aquabacterium sp.]
MTVEDASTSPARPRKRMGRPSRDEVLAGQDAPTLLLHAATAEFVEHGYDGTSTNRISERAGFAPQTFYRWYKDKLDVFIAVYKAWAEAEMAQLEAMLTEDTSSRHLAETCVESHRSFMTFKRSLRRLQQDAVVVRQACAQTRQAQLLRIRDRLPALSAEQVAALLIGIEHLCEALADGEFSDLGLSGEHAYAQLADMIDQLRPH